MTQHRFLKLAVPLALAAALLTGCGGGSDGYVQADNTPPSTETPSTGQTYDAFIAYVRNLVGSTSENTEPADVTAYDPALKADNTEPVKTE